MRRAITIAVKDGVHTVVSTPDVPLQEQQRAFKAARTKRRGEVDYDELQLWTSGGGVKRFKVKPAKGGEPKIFSDEGTAAAAASVGLETGPTEVVSGVSESASKPDSTPSRNKRNRF